MMDVILFDEAVFRTSHLRADMILSFVFCWTGCISDSGLFV